MKVWGSATAVPPPSKSKEYCMELAPIWTMQPMFSHLSEMPLRTLSPDASVIWDAVARNQANLNYRNALLLDASERPGGLWLESFPAQVWTEPKMARFLTGTHMFRLNSLVFVTTKLADQLRQLDLGVGGLTPVPVLRGDMRTPFDAPVYLLEYPNLRDTLDRDNSERCKLAIQFGLSPKYQLPQKLAGRKIIVHRGAEVGPDLWFDPMIWNYQFASDRAARLLIDAGLQAAFGLAQCQYL
jgi:hypothetical protein